MCSAIAIRQKLRGSWKGAAGAALTLVMLSAVAVVAFTLPGAEVFASWTTPESAEKAVASSRVARGPLTLEAPTSTLMRFRAETKDAQQSRDLASNAPLLVKDWKYTSGEHQPSDPQQPSVTNPLLELVQTSWTLYLQTTAFRVAEEAFDAYTAQVAQAVTKFFPPQLAALITSRLQVIGTQVDQVGTAYVQAAAVLQALINQRIPPALRPPAIPFVSPSI